MEIGFKETTTSPFPWNMRGRFCELESSDKTHFFEIYSAEYDVDLLTRLKKTKSFEGSRLGGFVNLIGEKNIPKQTIHLYKLQSYFANPSLSDPWEFNQSIQDYQDFGFSSFSDLHSFCLEKWGINVLDFVPRKETSIQS